MKSFYRLSRVRLLLAAAVLLLAGMAASGPAARAQEPPALRSLRGQFQRGQGKPRLILLLSPT